MKIVPGTDGILYCDDVPLMHVWDEYLKLYVGNHYITFDAHQRKLNPHGYAEITLKQLNGAVDTLEVILDASKNPNELYPRRSLAGTQWLRFADNKTHEASNYLRDLARVVRDHRGIMTPQSSDTASASLLYEECRLKTTALSTHIYMLSELIQRAN